MENKFNQDDLQFIQWLKHTLHQVDAFVVKPTDENTFCWATQDFLVEGKGKEDYKAQMIDSFIKDLTHQTKTYQYNIYHSNISQCTEIVRTLLDKKDNLTSHSLKLGMLRLFDGENELFKAMLEYCYETQDLALIFEVLKKSIHYGYIKSYEDSPLLIEVINYYFKIEELNQVKPEKITQSFIHHLKNSQMTISEANLINLYLSFFLDNDLAYFLNLFNIKKDDVLVDIQKNSFSKITLNLKTLLIAHLNYSTINLFTQELLKLNLDFPKFYLVSFDDNNLDILVEQKDKGSEKKVVMLFEELVAQKYDFQKDKQENFKTLIALVDRISEKINLEHILSNQAYVKAKLKV
jgi:hypothetical protein